MEKVSISINPKTERIIDRDILEQLEYEHEQYHQLKYELELLSHYETDMKLWRINQILEVLGK